MPKSYEPDELPEALCTSCGCIGPVEGQAANLIEELRHTNHLLHKDLEKKLRQINALQRDVDARLRKRKNYDQAIEVLEQWRDLCMPKAKEIDSHDRISNVLDRLDGGYTVAELVECAKGYSLKPYMVNGRRTEQGPKDCRKVDAELIYRTPRHVENGRAIFAQAQQLDQALTTEAPPPHTDIDTSDLSPIGVAAVNFADAGWHVFPCKVNEKAPATRNGFKDAIIDKQRIAEFWRKVPNANVAIATGKVSGLVVLDVDPRKDGSDVDGSDTLAELEKKHGDLPKTVSIVTPRGGQHFYFAHPGVEIRNTTGVPGPGLDIRGDGGYVLAPPSQVNGKRYELDEKPDTGFAPMPEWLIKAVQEHQTASNGARDYESIVSVGVKEGERNSQLLSLTGHLWSRGVDEGVIRGIVSNTNQVRCKPPLADKEVQKIVDSVKKMRARQEMQQ